MTSQGLVRHQCGSLFIVHDLSTGPAGRYRSETNKLCNKYGAYRQQQQQKVLKNDEHNDENGNDRDNDGNDNNAYKNVSGPIPYDTKDSVCLPPTPPPTQ